MPARQMQNHHHRAAQHAQRRAVWDFVATVADWRCTLCQKSIEFGDLEVFGRTRLCPKCSVTVNREDWLFLPNDETTQ
jgi:hypothetical protein